MVKLYKREKIVQKQAYNLDTSCIILAGGKGLRFGRNKVLETVGDKNLLEQVVSRIRLLCRDIVIVTTEEQNIPQFIDHPNLKIVTDTFPGKGPLGGIYTGLAISDAIYNLAVASDMPFLNLALLHYMIQLSANYDAVVPRLGKMVEPLHAVYSKSCLAPIENMIEQDKLSVYQLFNSIKVRYVEAEEIDRFDPGHLSIFNINTKADLETARKLAERDYK